MSLFCGWVERNHAVIGVDTEGIGAENSSAIETAKIFPLHVPAVLVFQGSGWFFGTFITSYLHKGGDFDAILAGMPGELARTLEGMQMFCTTPKLADAIKRQGVALVGWSPTQERMIGRAWVSVAGKFDDWEIDPFYALPWHESLTKLPPPSEPAAMKTIIEAQARITHEKEPGLAAGGNCLVAQITPDRVTIQQMGALPTRTAAHPVL